jgi:hypothetical protein
VALGWVRDAREVFLDAARNASRGSSDFEPLRRYAQDALDVFRDAKFNPLRALIIALAKKAKFRSGTTSSRPRLVDLIPAVNLPADCGSGRKL